MNAGGTLNLKEKAFKGVKITALAFFIVKFSSLIRQVILARILSPSDFGLIAFCLVVVGFLQNLIDLRMHETIIQTKENEQGMLNVGFSIQSLIAVIFVIGILFSAQRISHILNKPVMAIYLRVLAFRILTPVFIMPQALLHRIFDYRSIKIPEIADSLINTFVAIGLAIAGFGIWSLIWGLMAGWLVSVILILIIAKGFPRVSFNFPLFKKALKFGFPLYLTYLFHWVFWNADDFIVGRLLGIETLGYYWMAFYLAHHLIDLRFILSKVSFPVFARLQEDEARQAEILTKLTRSTAFVFFLISALLIPLARPTLTLIFGEKWIPATVPFMIFIGLVSMRATIDNGADLLMGVARVKYFSIMVFLQCIILLSLGPFAALRLGITGMAIIVFFAAALFAIYLITHVKKIIKISYIQMLWKNTLIAAATGIIAFLLKDLATDLSRFALVIFSCIIIYVVLFIIFDKLFMRDLKSYSLMLLKA